jgi:undecaprenyl-diphosphatase
MTLFQAIIQAFLSSFSQFVPVGEGLHSWILSEVLAWNSPSTAIQTAILLGCSFAIFIAFWNDWASLISSFLQVILLRKKPRTLDERLPFFISLATLVLILAKNFLAPEIPDWTLEPKTNAVFLVAGTFILWTGLKFSRDKKVLYDWNWLDSILAGIGQCLTLIPGLGRTLGVLSVSQFRHYHLDSGLRFAYLLALPALLLDAVPLARELTWRASTLDYEGTPWLNFASCFFVAFVTSTITIQAFQRQTRIEGWKAWMKYRIAVGVLLVITLIVRSH